MTLRQGIGGHHGLVGEVGVDVIAEPTPKLTVSLGPRLSFASADYLDTYLGVSAAESVGLRPAGIRPGRRHQGRRTGGRGALCADPAWSVVAKAGYERLVGDAADSPVTEAGSENQFKAGIGLTYRFGLNLFD